MKSDLHYHDAAAAPTLRAADIQDISTWLYVMRVILAEPIS